MPGYTLGLYYPPRQLCFTLIIGVFLIVSGFVMLFRSRGDAGRVVLYSLIVVLAVLVTVRAAGMLTRW